MVSPLQGQQKSSSFKAQLLLRTIHEKVENGNQDGVWPAYWMMGENMNEGVGWPYCGEIDIMEHANSNNYIGGCLHWNTKGMGEYSPGSYGSGFQGAEKSFGYYTDNANNGINGWHVYGLIWDENHMEWQMDGKTFLTQAITDNNAYCFQKEHFISERMLKRNSPCMKCRTFEWMSQA